MAAHQDFKKIKQQRLNERETNRSKIGALRALSSKLDNLQKSIHQHICKLTKTKKKQIKNELIVLSGSVVVTLTKKLPFPRRPGFDVVTYEIDNVYVKTLATDDGTDAETILESSENNHYYKSNHLYHLENNKLIPDAYDFMLHNAADCEYQTNTEECDDDEEYTTFIGTWSGSLYAHTLAINSDRLCEIPEFGEHLFSKFEFKQIDAGAPELFGTLEFAEQLTETCTKTLPTLIEQFGRIEMLSEFGFVVTADLYETRSDCSLRTFVLENVEVCAIAGPNVNYKYNQIKIEFIETKIRETYGGDKMLWPNAQKFAEVYIDSAEKSDTVIYTGSLYLHCCYGWPFGDELGQKIMSLFSEPLSSE